MLPVTVEVVEVREFEDGETPVAVIERGVASTDFKMIVPSTSFHPAHNDPRCNHVACYVRRATVIGYSLN